MSVWGQEDADVNPLWVPTLLWGRQGQESPSQGQRSPSQGGHDQMKSFCQPWNGKLTSDILSHFCSSSSQMLLKQNL